MACLGSGSSFHGHFVISETKISIRRMKILGHACHNQKCDESLKDILKLKYQRGFL
jgi:hypothetical protein